MTSASGNQIPPRVSANHPLGPLEELIDELRTFTQDTAKNGQSDDLGVRIVIDGDTSDTLVPVFFRCTWPADAKTRHILIWMKPSISSVALGNAVNDAFRVIEAGGIVTKTRAIWGGVNPFADSRADGIAARETVRRAVGLDNSPTRQQIIKMMEGTMDGIMQVVVESMQDAAKCFNCHQPHALTPENLDDIRRSAQLPIMFCRKCIQEVGRQEIDRIQDRAVAEAQQRAQDSLINPVNRDYTSHVWTLLFSNLTSRAFK